MSVITGTGWSPSSLCIVKLRSYPPQEFCHDSVPEHDETPVPGDPAQDAFFRVGEHRGNSTHDWTAAQRGSGNNVPARFAPTMAMLDESGVAIENSCCPAFVGTVSVDSVQRRRRSAALPFPAPRLRADICPEPPEISNSRIGTLVDSISVFTKAPMRGLRAQRCGLYTADCQTCDRAGNTHWRAEASKLKAGTHRLRTIRLNS